jgi:hypothetical protein
MVLVDTVVMFIFQVAKKDGSLYPPMKYVLLIFLVSINFFQFLFVMNFRVPISIA